MPDPARLFLPRSERGALDVPGRLGPSPATGDTSRVWATFAAESPGQNPGELFWGESVRRRRNR